MKSILWMLATPFILLILAAILIHLPPVQNYIVGKATAYLTEGTGFRTEIGYANIKWFNAIALDNTQIYDQNEVLMIGVDELVVTFDLADLIGKKNIRTREAWLKGANVNLRDDSTGGLNIDEWADRIGKLTASDTPSDAPAGTFSIDQITLLDSRFSISDSRKDSITNGFDYNHFQLVDLNADLLNLKVVSDTFQIDVKSLSTRDPVTGLTIDNLQTFFRNSSKGLVFFDLDLKMGNTHIKDFIELRHERPSQMGYFVDSVNIKADFDETRIHTDELGFFVPELKKYNQSVNINGLFQGRVNKFFSDNFSISFGQDSRFKGAIDIEGLPNIDQTIFGLTLRESTLKATDLRKYIGPEAFRISNKFGLIRMSGQFDGLLNDFVADGSFQTRIGRLESNIQIRIIEGEAPYYRGDLFLQNFDIGRFTEVSNFQKIDLDGRVEGTGFTLETANFELDAVIPKVGINGYNYTNIETDGAFAESFFSGQIDVDDPMFKLFATGSVDLREGNKLFKLRGRLDTALLKEVKLTEEEMLVSTNFNLDITGLKLDSIRGSISLSDTYYRFKQKDIELDSVFFEASRNSNGRKFTIVSDLFDADFSGDFEFTGIAKELSNINEQYRLQFSSRSEEVNSFLRRSPPTKKKFNLNYSVDLHNISPLIQLFDSTIYVAKNTKIEGRFDNRQGQSLVLSSQVDTVQFGKIYMLENDLYINTKDIRDPEKVFAQGYLSSEKQIFSNSSETNKLVLEAVWDGKRMDIKQTLTQASTGNYAEISAGINFYPDRTELRFEDSNITALNETWKITEENVVVFGNQRIDFENLSIYNTDQSISFNGQIAITQDSSQTLTVNFSDVEVANINPLTSESYTGKLSGTVNAQNLYYNPIIFGDIEVIDFKINEFLVGNLDGSITWNDFRQRFDVDFEVNRLNRRIIAMNGQFYPARSENQLAINLRLNEANLNIAEPYIDDYFSNLGGFIDGRYTISGNIDSPLMKGQGAIKEGRMKINYLNTSYNFEGGIDFSKDVIALENLQFVDARNQTAQFGGRISHNSFKDFRLDLIGQLNQFQVLNTNVDNGDAYYGSAIATGQVSLSGEASSLNISAKVKTERDTRIYIPITEDTGNNDVPEYITFVDRTVQDTTSTKDSLINEVNKIKIEGLKLDLDIEVTPEAYVEIIIDPRTGDIIRGRGDGQLRLLIDTQGDFQMTGELDITEGAYNFSLYNLITKEFQIEQPSTITWYGDPYAAVMDIKASYTQNTSLAPLLEQSGGSVSQNGGISRRVPTKVLLYLDGPMLSPNIGFDIDFTDLNVNDYQLTTAINAFKNRVQSDEQELNRQVLSLIVLNRFSEQGGLRNIGGRTTTQNVSQLLSNQLSQLVAQLDENLEVNFDLADLDQDAFNTFRLRLSYTFLDGRLRVTREGAISGDINNIAGDITAEYLLTTDGKYKVKVFSQNNYNPADRALSQQPTNQTQGVSISQTTSFNNLREFFNGVNNSRKKRKEEKKDNNTEGNTN
ncbi:translocation/assembly module TamB domain-containing protein [Roseivirga sp. UBA838]|uniref:translocation/assembly module TamB domain-containing protein n=1 Tax=Roseivirga sp. UBA838 TaxID=1947393 RepID=UPI00257CC83F|nr:translocation/assembly module TamB domain-containing protein [Roseivirga sp. UBA838]